MVFVVDSVRQVSDVSIHVFETEQLVEWMRDRDHIVVFQDAFVALAEFSVVDVCAVTREILMRKQEKRREK